MEAILGLDVPIASVVRAGHLRTIPAEGLVPGDVVDLAGGHAYLLMSASSTRPICE
jgi:magnesium-transporting ATPase (P-type)